MKQLSVKTKPLVSVLLPTLNAASVLEKCLRSIADQDYPKEKIEIIVADGGSTDKTLDIIREFGPPNRRTELRIQTVKNPLRTGEAGKAVALRYATGELVASIDSDNVLPDKNWLKKMVEPFSDPEIIGAEPWEFTWRSQDGFIDRYCALMGMNDPVCYFLGNYDRFCILTGKWTGLPVEEEDKGGWIKATLKSGAIPTIGANGTILKRKVLVEGGLVGDYLFDIDIIAQLAAHKPVKFAKVKTGIIHLYCGSNIGKFVRKQTRRIRDYLYYQKRGVRQYPWQRQNKMALLKFILACVAVLPLFYQAIKGYLKKPDPAWFFHPLACWLTLGVYSWRKLVSTFSIKEMARERWGQ